MKSISIMEAQHNRAKWLREVEAGGELTITRRKRAVAKLSPPHSETPVEFPDFKSRARRTWGDSWTGSGTDELLDESRGDR
jgi:antitoxin (DNA-binding transcriptional repressor) of toxin-antitoxin stability system